MATYFVSPPEASDWSLEAAELRVLLAERFPDAEITGPATPDDPFALHWTIPTASGVPLDGTLHGSGDAVHMDGDVEDAAEFAVWLRGLVPPEQPLVFYDEGYTADVEITPDSRPEDLAAPFLA